MIEKYALFRVLRGLLDGEDSIRGIAEKSGVGVTTSKMCLDYLLSKAMVKRNIIGRSYFYSFNLSNFLARHIKVLLSLYEINDSGIVNELVSEYPVSSIILYGSVARGEDDARSDIDILVMSRKKTRISSLKAERKLGRELTILTYTLLEWKAKSKEDKVFYDRIIVDGIPLYGDIPIVR